MTPGQKKSLLLRLQQTNRHPYRNRRVRRALAKMVRLATRAGILAPKPPTK